MPGAVTAWKSSLTAYKAGSTKLADTIADPASSPEVFEEGWDAALAKEEQLVGGAEDPTPNPSAAAVVVNGNGAANGIATPEPVGSGAAAADADEDGESEEDAE